MKFLIPVILFLLTLVFGFWLSNLGKPYNGLLFNIHKLIALGAVIFTVVQLSKIFKDTSSPALIIILLILAGIGVIALFASGALMSIGKPDYPLMLTIHRIAVLILVIPMGLVVYLLGSKQ